MAWLAAGAVTRELRDGELVVGSGPDADWRVQGFDLMPRHFVVLMHGLNVSVRPCNSEVVVVLNGRQLAAASKLLEDGDVIAAGHGRFVFSEDTPRTDDAPPPAVGDGYLVDEASHTAYRLVNRSTAIGRDASNAIIVRDPRASRFHGEIRREAGGFALHTMGSGGTSLNGQPMRRPSLLADGDMVEIAYTRFRFTRGPLVPGTTVAPERLDMNDALAEQTTVLRPRSTMESPAHAAEPPRPIWTPKVIVAIVVIVLVGILARVLVAR